MSKILELDEFKYSKKEFEDYKFRSIFRLVIDKDWRNDIHINIYTDNPDRTEVMKVIASKTTDKVIEVVLDHWTTKEQDVLTMEFLEETLKDL